ncbi:protein translocase subunit SecD [bacterium]|nr:protein translocase subunit SecD [bacterium]
MYLRFAPWKLVVIFITIAIGAFLAFPNVLPLASQEAHPTGALKLGLDLRGGVAIQLEVDQEDLRANRLRQLSRDIRETLRAQPSILTGTREVAGDAVLVPIRDAAKLEEARERIEKLGAPVTGAIGAPRSLTVEQRSGNILAVSLTRDALDRLQADAIANSIEGVRRRVDAGGVNEPNIQKQGDSRIVVEVPGESDPARLVDLISRAGVLTFNLVDVAAIPGDYVVGEPSGGRVALASNDLNGAPQVVFEDPIIEGADLQSAAQGFDERGVPRIEFRLNPVGASRFGKATQENVGTPFAIVLDNQIVSAPVIRSPILGGSGVIEGNFSIEEAENIAIILRTGALPAKLNVVEQRVVDASLGRDSIEKGLTAMIVGLCLVVLFMLVGYGLLGVFAVVALGINMVLLLGVLSGVGATLTLPGIAGILLTVGMAVDANVLVFERIREEKRSGRSPVSSIESGYSQAMSTILDANITTLLAALILFFLGAGPVRGFAVTLSVGIFTSMFTSIVVTRLMIAYWIQWTRPKHVPI